MFTELTFKHNIFSFFIVAMVTNWTSFLEERTKKYSEKLQFYFISNTKFIKYCKFHKESFVIFKNYTFFFLTFQVLIFLNISMHYWKIEKLHYLRSVRNKMVFFLFKGSVIKKAIVKSNATQHLKNKIKCYTTICKYM